jgi:hypothetical protein
VFACGCKGSYTLKQEITNSSAIFTAKVEKNMYHRKWSYIFNIEDAWKGFALRSNFAVKPIIVTKNSCDYFFEDGKTYLVFVDRVLQNHEIDVTSCSRTIEIEKADDLLDSLGAPEVSHKEIVIGEKRN